MTPDEIGARLSSLLGEPRPERSVVEEPSGDAGAVTGTIGTETGTAAAALGAVARTVSGGGPFARGTVDVPVSQWRAAVQAARDDAELGMDFFDWLSAVDEQDGGFDLVVHVWSVRKRHGLLLRTRLADRAAPLAPSIVDIYPGAAWHERETREMFGITFTDPGDGTPVVGSPLLLPEEFEGHPLRKEFVLATRAAKPWPGAKEPGESGHGGPAKRQPMRAMGVPDPREWGPNAGAVPEPEEARPRRTPAADRPARPSRPDRPARPAAADRPPRTPTTDDPPRTPPMTESE
jgi:NADH-quinone oxidoreductase subunit C